MWWPLLAAASRTKEPLLALATAAFMVMITADCPALAIPAMPLSILWYTIPFTVITGPGGGGAITESLYLIGAVITAFNCTFIETL